MPFISTTSLILSENMRVTRSMSKIAARVVSRKTPAAVLVRPPLSEKSASVNTDVLPPATRKASVVRPHPTAKPTFAVPFPYKSGFGFTPGGAPRIPEERECLRKERLAFFCRLRAHGGLPKIRVWVHSATQLEAKSPHDSVGRRTSFHLIVPSPLFLAPPPISYGGRILTRDAFSVVPEVREHAPPEWDEWRPTRRPEHNPVVDRSMLFVPLPSLSGYLYPGDLKTLFSDMAQSSRIAHSQCPHRQEALLQGALCGLWPSAPTFVRAQHDILPSAEPLLSQLSGHIRHLRTSCPGVDVCHTPYRDCDV
ncbi:hypothetical protein B0F90DRAFT_1819428 [Multifurca ochricompacta]|uniref:Uncharacterized protein n=1 Tax=Multifurca ochricompacta TaxID=376703 RepID=A0AAD4QJ38_9AGAM|nr:hypothetical protein B0F90DRAFT_1819428 [Multifurca ochricompacta]